MGMNIIITKTKDFPGDLKNESNFHQPLNVSAQKDRPESSICENRQNEELSSTNLDYQEIKEASVQQSHCNSLDEVVAEIKSGAKNVTIPTKMWNQIVENFVTGGHQDNPGELGQNGAFDN